MISNNYIAIDLGATSGRLVVYNDKKELDEIHRFSSYLKNENGHFIWDISFIYENILIGLKKATAKYHYFVSLSIDSWGVDYCLLHGDKIIEPVYSYRDQRVNESVKKVHALIPFKRLYEISGIQFVQFNSIYQLFQDLNEGRLDKATDFLHIPEYLSFLLTGKKVHEYTMASTTGLIDLKTKEYSLEIINKLNLPKFLFGKVVHPGTSLGPIKKEICEQVGLSTNLNVIMCASHDTGSAFHALDVNDDTIIISSGTWSLIGVKIKDGNNSEKSFNSNFTNEGGVNYIRYLKNIMGMWIFNEVRRKQNYSFNEINDLVNKSSFDGIFDVNDPSLLSPSDMKSAIMKLLKLKAISDGDLYRSIYFSLAHSYRQAISQIEENLNKKYSHICILGGGAKNVLLNNIVSLVTGYKVIAMPIEATALGNIKVQKGE